jgi:hypothetical protein
MFYRFDVVIASLHGGLFMSSGISILLVTW